MEWSGAVKPVESNNENIFKKETAQVLVLMCLSIWVQGVVP